MTPIIYTKNLSKTFGSNRVLHNVNIEIYKGESVVILGASGVGKSVLMKCICGFIKPDQDSIVVIEEESVAQQHISQRQKFTQNAAVVFQSNALFDSMSIADNIAFNLNIEQEQLKKSLQAVGLADDILHLYPNQISGGMQKRVALARAIVRRPHFIFCDEPTSGLDPLTSKKIAELVCSLQQKYGVTLISVSHDPVYTSIVANRLLFLEKSGISWQGQQENISKQSSDFLQMFRVHP